MSQANLSISSISTREPIFPGSPVSLIVVVKNSGSLSSNDTVLRLYISGPSGFATNFSYALSPILPDSNETLSFTLSRATPVPGTYNVAGNVTYVSVYTSGSYHYVSGMLVSPNFKTSYLVSPLPQIPHRPQPTGYFPVPAASVPPTPIGNISFTEFPLLTTMVNGSSSILPLRIYNNGTSPIWVNITNYFNETVRLSPSARNIYLLGHQGLRTDILASVNRTVSEGYYVVPLNISVSAPSSKLVLEHLFLGISVRNRFHLNPAIFNNLMLENLSRDASGQIDVTNPYNTTLFNSTLSLMLPLSAVNTSSDISLAGAVGNVSVFGSDYLLQWRVPEILPNQNYSVYYTLSNVQNPDSLQSFITTFAQPSTIPESVLTLLDVDVPIFYVNQSDSISVTTLYVGADQENISFYLLAPSTVPVINPKVAFHAYPNMVLAPQFNISGIKTPGTYMLSLEVVGHGINHTYSIPIVVLPAKPAVAPSSVPTALPSLPITGQKYIINGAREYADALSLAIVIIVVVVATIKNLRKAKRSRKRMHELSELKERIQRGEFE